MSSDLKQTYLTRNGGDTCAAAAELARSLMQGDATSFRAGYSADNAAIAAAEVFDLTAEQVNAVSVSVGASVAVVRAALREGAS